ncbi:MAG: DNA polymerase III subunit delta, partial [Candidatus Peregrinibacteria bacterium]
KFAADLQTIPESSVVVFIQPHPDKRKSFYKSLVKLAKVEEFKSMEGPVLDQWVCREAKKVGAQLDGPTADYLISLAGQNCWRLSQEIQKLASYKPDQPITRADIDHVVTPTLEANIFHFTDALSAKDYKKAIYNLHRSMAAGEDLRQLFYMIVRQFRLLLQVKSYKEEFPLTNPLNLSSALKLHPFVARNVMGQIGHFKTSELKKAYAQLLQIDTDLKTSRIRVTADNSDELALAVEQFILKFCA